MTTQQDDRTTPGFRPIRENDGDRIGVAEHGTRIADYIVRRVLGEGGMGIVYLADQVGEVERPVALKLIRAPLHDTMAAAQFEIERRALARMDHPAIAQVYAVGTTADGFPYLAMQWIDGPPLNVWVRKQRPSLRARVALMAEVARGVAHAHARGILHRDLKPANILVASVDGRAEPKIIDFGIAIGISGSGQDAGRSERVGTLGYMSPEQAGERNDAVDVRSDVYALGMILLELLIPGEQANLGTTAPALLQLRSALHTSQSLVEGLHSDHAARQTSAQALAGLGSELRAILRRATAPDPSDRYASAGLFAEDLERHLAGEAVTAMPQTTWYRATRYVRRHRLGLGAGALIVLALSAGLFMSLRAQRVAERERERAEVAAAEAKRESERSAAIANLWRDVLMGLDPERARGQDTTLLKQILTEAHAEAERSSAKQPRLLAEIEAIIGGTYFAVDENAIARETLMRARDRLGGDDSDAAEQLRLRIDDKIAYIDIETRRRDEAIPRMQDALARATRRFGEKSGFARDARAAIGWFNYRKGDFESARRQLHDVLDEIEAEGGRDSREYASVLMRHASASIDGGDFAEGERGTREAIAIYERLEGADHPRVLAARNSLAVSLMRQHKFAEAAPLLTDLLAVSEKIYGPNHLQTVQLVNNLAGALRQSGQVTASGPMYRRAYESMKERDGPDAPMVLMTANNYALYMVDAGELDTADALHRDTMRRSLAVFADHPFVYSELHFTNGKILAARGETQAALDEFEQAYKLRVGVIGDDKPESIEIKERIDQLRGGAGDTAAAPTP